MANRWRERLLKISAAQRVTRAGWIYSAATLLVALAAFLSANNLLFLLLAAMLATLMLSGLVSRLVLAGLEVDFLLPEHVAARRKTMARITIRNHKRWMPSFSIHLTGAPPSVLTATFYFPVLGSRATAGATAEVTFGRRGSHRESSFQLATRFPFGFVERRALVSLRREAIVYPCLDPQPGFDDLLSSVSGEIEARQRGRGHDFYRIRPYEPLESARHVDWKATAHTGELQVREFAREQDPLIEIFLDLNTATRHREWFERAVECCAFLVWRVSLREARIRFRTQEFECFFPVEGDVHRVLRYLALVPPRRVDGLVEPVDEDGCQVVFSARPEQLRESNWRDALILGPEDFPLSVADWKLPNRA
jgi:uncharacterized protein (DUF58 family)